MSRAPLRLMSHPVPDGRLESLRPDLPEPQARASQERRRVRAAGHPGRTSSAGAGTLAVAAERAAQALAGCRLRVAVAESCTGGLLAVALTDVPGSSAYFLGGIVAYHDQVKVRELGVPQAALREHGAVSKEVARAMAVGVRRLLNADLAVGITGVAGPGAQGPKPAGLTYIALASATGTEERRYQWNGDRRANRAASVEAALRLLVDACRQYRS